MYRPAHIYDLIAWSEAAALKPIERYGVTVFVDADSDYVGADIYISKDDAKGIEIFREFAAKMAAHYNNLKK